MSDLSGWGRRAGGSVLNPSDTCTGGRRAFIPETSGVIYASTPNCGPLRRFCRDGFPGITPKTPILPRSA